ncbi:MAG: methyltransferase domain-containing protein [Nitrospinaceae bacterium]|nr:methyltransferase domain-containing protein [Nitrospinaceae bacterium]NIR56349.1 methyltransferase domain-containing protein [Nitrospinaceae bacterium]NIS86809.1 methyltransferase domain-containing protein [Nitrospinaceae bacterium]NIT83643.1 methyltransferase domain-containing protein [Nitrospinaceae bacterium]NIU45846.1 methyltransferase domain-containing protein [Nitrospinaceae bacterium]
MEASPPSGQDFEQKVIASFSKHVKTYDRHAQLQRSMAERLASLIPHPVPKTLLEIGCGTGVFTRHLLARNPSTIYLNDIAPLMIDYLKSHIALPPQTRFLSGNAETLPIPKVNLITGNAVFQWFQNPEDTVKKYYRSLKHPGFLAFSTFGPKTLQEFRDTAGFSGPTTLLSQHQLKKMLTGAGFHLLQFQTETRQIFFDNTHNLIKNLQQIGAAPLRMFKPGELKRLIRDYDRNFGTPQGVYTNWELFYFSAEKK